MTEDFSWEKMKKMEKIGKPEVVDLLKNKCQKIKILEESPKADLDKQGIDLIGEYNNEHVTLDVKIDSHGNSRNLIWEIKSNCEQDNEGWAYSSTNIWVPALGFFWRGDGEKITSHPVEEVSTIEKFTIEHLFLFKMKEVRLYLEGSLDAFRTVAVTTNKKYTTKSKVIPYGYIEHLALWSYHSQDQESPRLFD